MEWSRGYSSPFFDGPDAGLFESGFMLWGADGGSVASSHFIRIGMNRSRLFDVWHGF